MKGIVVEDIGNAATLRAGGVLINGPKLNRIRALEGMIRRNEPRPLRNDQLSYGFDLDLSSNPRALARTRWHQPYNIGLFGKLGVQCYNLQKGTNFKFLRLEKYNSLWTSDANFYITLELVDPAINSVLSFQTLLRDSGYATANGGIYLRLYTLACRLKCNDRVDKLWDDTTIDGFYRGPLPKWFSDHEFASHPRRFYEVQESDLPDNDWLQLFSELAFFAEAKLLVTAPPGLDIKKIVIETKEEYTTEAREKLKADNAIFYISYKCTCTGVESSSKRGLAGDHKSVLRKTMDGKPGHICIEVASENEE